MPQKKASKSAKARHARERESEPINSASYAAVARRGLVATGPPASSTHAAEETREDYEGGMNNHQVPPGESISFMQLLQQIGRNLDHLSVNLRSWALFCCLTWT